MRNPQMVKISQFEPKTAGWCQFYVHDFITLWHIVLHMIFAPDEATRR
jgi:hypothetical protein